MSVWPCYRLSAWYNHAANPIRHYGWEAWAVVNAARFAKLGERQLRFTEVQWFEHVGTSPSLHWVSPVSPERPQLFHRCPGETIESKAGGLQLIQAIAGLGPQVRVSWGKPFGMKIGDVFPRFFWMNWHWPFFWKKNMAQTCSDVFHMFRALAGFDIKTCWLAVAIEQPQPCWFVRGFPSPPEAQLAFCTAAWPVMCKSLRKESEFSIVFPRVKRISGRFDNPGMLCRKSRKSCTSRSGICKTDDVKTCCVN